LMVLISKTIVISWESRCIMGRHKGIQKPPNCKTILPPFSFVACFWNVFVLNIIRSLLASLIKLCWLLSVYNLVFFLKSAIVWGFLHVLMIDYVFI
jgi:hypothetical protein